MQDGTTENLSKVIEQNFEDLCTELKKKNVLKALLRLDVLFIIDGFDEVDNNSMKIVNEIIKGTWRLDSRVLITTRPHTVKEKLTLLQCCNDVSSAQYEVLPLMKLADQLLFLRRYEETMCGGTPTGEMTRSFESLSKDVRSQFTEPFNLVHFCEMHKHFPETISSWQTLGDVAQCRLLLYRKLVKFKLSATNLSATDVRLDDLFDEIGAKARKCFAKMPSLSQKSSYVLLIRSGSISLAPK